MPSHYDPLLPNGGHQLQMQIDGVSSIKDEQLLSATGAEFGFGTDKETNFEDPSPQVGPHQYGPLPHGGQPRQHLMPRHFESADGRLPPSAALPRLPPGQQFNVPDHAAQHPPAL